MALFLAAAFLTVSFASCSEGAKTSADVTVQNETTEQAETTYPRPDIPKTDFGGETFMICCPAWGLCNDYFFAEEQTGEQMNDAIYNRAAAVEDYLGINIDKHQLGSILDVKPTVQLP